MKLLYKMATILQALAEFIAYFLSQEITPGISSCIMVNYPLHMSEVLFFLMEYI